ATERQWPPIGAPAQELSNGRFRGRYSGCHHGGEDADVEREQKIGQRKAAERIRLLTLRLRRLRRGLLAIWTRAAYGQLSSALRTLRHKPALFHADSISSSSPHAAGILPSHGLALLATESLRELGNIGHHVVHPVLRRRVRIAEYHRAQNFRANVAAPRRGV